MIATVRICETHRPPTAVEASSHAVDKAPDLGECGALGGTRTPNLLIRSQMLYPLSYERRLNLR